VPLVFWGTEWGEGAGWGEGVGRGRGVGEGVGEGRGGGRSRGRGTAQPSVALGMQCEVKARGKYKDAVWTCDIDYDSYRYGESVFVVQWDITSECVASSFTFKLSLEAMQKWAANKDQEIYFPIDDGKHAFLYMPTGCMLHYEKDFRFGFMTPHADRPWFQKADFVRSLLMIDGDDVKEFYKSDVSRVQQLFSDIWDAYTKLQLASHGEKSDVAHLPKKKVNHNNP